MSTAKERYRQYLQSDDWRKKRDAKRRHRDRCAICGDTRNLDVHHLDYKNWTDVLQSDLRVFCRRCHTVTHDLIARGVIKFKPNASHHSRFATTKNAVRKVIGESGMHWPKDPNRVKPTSKPTGYTKAKLAAWGVPWPPPRGWKRKLIAAGVIQEGPDVPVIDAPYDPFAAIWVTP